MTHSAEKYIRDIHRAQEWITNESNKPRSLLSYFFNDVNLGQNSCKSRIHFTNFKNPKEEEDPGMYLIVTSIPGVNRKRGLILAEIILNILLLSSKQENWEQEKGKKFWIFPLFPGQNFLIQKIKEREIQFFLLPCWYHYFFQILWKSRCNIWVSFPSHLKKLRSILRFWLEKLNCGFFHSFHSRKNTTKQLFQSKFQYRK